MSAHQPSALTLSERWWCDHERARREAMDLLNRLYDLDAEAPLLTQPDQWRLADLLGRPRCGGREGG